MNITFSNPISFNGIIPLKKYTGPILKLTETEEAKISSLQENINNFEMELYNLNKLFEGKRLSTGQSNYYFNKVMTISAQIDDLKQMIRQIKIDRLNMQKTN